MKKSKNKKNYILVVLLLLVVTITVGYAALSTTLNINGTSTIGKQSWDVHFANLSVTSGSVTATEAATITAGKTTEITYEVTLAKPGDFYEFTVDVTNAGTIDAKTAAAPTISGNTLTDVTNYTATWSDGTAIAANQTLAGGASKKLKVRIEYKKDITADQLPTTDTALTLKFSLPYVQA